MGKRTQNLVTIISPFTLYSGHHLEWTRLLAQQLVHSGREVQIICTGGTAILAQEKAVKIIKVDFGFKLFHKFSRLNASRSSSRYGLIQNLETFACALIAYLFSTKSRVIYWMDGRHYLLLIFVLLLKNQRHIHGVMGGVPYGTKGPSKFLHWLYRQAFSTNRLTFIAETDAVRKDWSKLAGNHVVTIPVAIDEVKETAPQLIRVDLGIQPSDFVCLLFGTHRADKDYRTVIEGAKRSKTQPFLLFAGPLISENDPEKLLRASDYKKGVAITRYVTEKEMQDVFALSDCAILPYAKGYEKGSAVLLQACQHDRPVLVADTGHLRRFVEEYHTGLYYRPEDAVDFAEKIDQMAALHVNRDFWKENLAAVRKTFSWEKILPKYLEILDAPAKS